MKNAAIHHNRLEIIHLSVQAGNKKILHDLNFNVKAGEIQVIMGPNGSGKTSLLMALTGHPDYKIIQGKIILNQHNITHFAPHKKVKLGLMMTWQNPSIIRGLTVKNMLRTASTEINEFSKQNITKFYDQLNSIAKELHIPVTLLNRGLNEDFSGGEKKLIELLCLNILNPQFILIDEIDTGLDIDTLKIVALNIAFLQKQGCGIILVTHYQRILKYLKFQKLHIIKKGQIVKTGDVQLLKQIEKNGYSNL